MRVKGLSKVSKNIEKAIEDLEEKMEAALNRKTDTGDEMSDRCGQVIDCLVEVCELIEEIKEI